MDEKTMIATAWLVGMVVYLVSLFLSMKISEWAVDNNKFGLSRYLHLEGIIGVFELMAPIMVTIGVYAPIAYLILWLLS